MYDGWNDDSAETWTYATPTSFTVPGNLTAQYTPGTRIKFTQTTVKFFVVTSSSYSGGNTTVNVTGGTDYTVANAAISSNNHSYAANPQGYPGWFNWLPTVTGWSGSPTIQARFSVTGRTCVMCINVTGTSNSIVTTFTAPIDYSAVGMAGMIQGAGVATDNGTRITPPPFVEIDTANPHTVYVYPTSAGGSWTASGTKLIAVTLVYEI